MTRPSSIAAVLASVFVLLSSTHAAAHGDHPELHVGTAHDSCYFDLHPELTARQLRQWAAEAGQILRYRQLSGAETLGARTVDLGLGFSYFFIDDAKGAWNNTMSHPNEEHYLGDLGFPFLELRVGVSDRVDLEIYGTVNWQSNYGFFGVATKIGLLDEREGAPVSLSVRPSLSALVGPAELQAYNLSTDVALSRSFRGFAPFVGGALSSTLAVESSSDTDVGNQGAVRAVGFVGFEYRWRFLSLAVQGEISAVPGLAAHLGGSF